MAHPHITPRFLRLASSNLVAWAVLRATNLRLRDEVCPMTEVGFSEPNDPLDAGDWLQHAFPGITVGSFISVMKRICSLRSVDATAGECGSMSITSVFSLDERSFAVPASATNGT